MTTTVATKTIEVNADERRLIFDALILLEQKKLDDLMATIPGTIKEQGLKSDRTWIAELKAKVR